jgi:hypothetical protein
VRHRDRYGQRTVAHSRAVDLSGGSGVPSSDLFAEQLDDAELDGDADGDTHDVREFHREVPRVELTCFAA